MRRRLLRAALLLAWLIPAALVSVGLLPVPPAWALRPLDPAAAVVEVLQLTVAEAQWACWQRAEQAVWEPWLERQAGYRGRDLLWDSRREQAVVLVGWETQAAWDAIPAASIEATQVAFDGALQRCLGTAAPQPLPLVRTGVLRPMGAVVEQVAIAPFA